MTPRTTDVRPIMVAIDTRRTALIETYSRSMCGHSSNNVRDSYANSSLAIASATSDSLLTM